MIIWTLTMRSGRRHRRIVGVSASDALAHADALRALSALNAAAGFEHPRYELTVDGHLTAIVQTGVDPSGLPDHHGIADLLRHLEHQSTDPRLPFTPAGRPPS